MKDKYDLVRGLRHEWSNAGTKVSDLTGGLVNRSYLVEAGQDLFTVRLPGENTEIYIDRRIEKINVEILAEVGIAPRVVEYRKDGTMIRTFVRGVAATKDSFKDPTVRKEAIKSIRRLHESDIQLCNRFDVFNKIRNYRQILNSYDHRIARSSFGDDVLVMIDRIEAILATCPTRNVPCHNDLLPGNFVLTHDGVNIIDWEYAGMNDKCYDVANHVTELDNLSQDEENNILRLYFGEEAIHQQEKVDLYKLPSRFLWALWASIQFNISVLEFDFEEYARLQFDRCSEYMRLLETKYPSIMHG